MSAVIQSPSSRENYLTHARGVRSWLCTTDHKRISIMYLLAILLAFCIGGVFAVLLRTRLLAGSAVLVAPTAGDAARAQAWEIYNNMFTLHGTVMIFLFLIPCIPAVLGNFLLPMMLGAKNVVFPRLNLLSFYVYCAGAILLLYVVFSGVLQSAFGINLPGGFGLDTGWTFYAPYHSSGKVAGSVTVALLAILILGVSAVLIGINTVASIHTLRPPGMTWFRMPLFLWALYGSSITHILATPVLAVTLVLIAAEQRFHIGIFDPKLGGDPILFQHFFWFYAHPAVYITLLPAMGIVSELVSTFSRKHIFGYKFIAYASITIALLGFLNWGQHMFVSGQSGLVNAIFSLMTFGIVVPAGIKIFSWIATLYRGSIRLQAPLIFALCVITLFTIGGLTGMLLGAIALDVHLTKTSFIVAHLHYAMVGSGLFAFLGGMYYWWPKITGRMYSQKYSIAAAILMFVGFNLTFFPLFIAGSLGMPRRYATYEPRFRMFHVTSSIGAYIMAAGLVIVLLTWLQSLARGRKAPANPWGANSLEWHVASPPPFDNFEAPPAVGDPYDLTAWKAASPEEGWVREQKSGREQELVSN